MRERESQSVRGTARERDMCHLRLQFEILRLQFRQLAMCARCCRIDSNRVGGGAGLGLGSLGPVSCDLPDSLLGALGGFQPVRLEVLFNDLRATTQLNQSQSASNHATQLSGHRNSRERETKRPRDQERENDRERIRE